MMAEELQITLIQAPLAWEQPEANRTTFSQSLALVPDTTDLVILPEMFTTGFTMTPGNIAAGEGAKTLRWMQEAAARYKAALCGSIAFREGSRFFNRLFFVTPEGETRYYDKRHTFTLAGEDKVYTAGREKLVVEYRGFRICPLICYDLRFPVWSRNTEGYDLLLFVANWPAPRVQAWDTLLKARAIENMAYCAGVNRVGTDANEHAYSGHSAVYDCLGNTMVYSEEAGQLHATLCKSHLQKTRESLKFLDDRDTFTLAP